MIAVARRETLPRHSTSSGIDLYATPGEILVGIESRTRQRRIGDFQTAGERTIAVTQRVIFWEKVRQA
jgi:hypothetical protein